MFFARLGVGLLLSLVFAHHAWADTYCGSVSPQVQILNPTIMGAPRSVALASYDLNNHGLSVQWAGQGNKALYFVGVPQSVIVGKASVPWTSISSYPQALVQDQSTCPVLSVSGSPILTTGNSAMPPSANIQNPCTLVSDGTELQPAAISFPPYSIYFAVYDAKTQYLIVQFAGGDSALFVGVPSTVASGNIEWNTLYQYTEAIMAEQSACPLLAGGAAPPLGWIFGISAFGVGNF